VTVFQIERRNLLAGAFAALIAQNARAPLAAMDRPLVAEPGMRWNYCGGATALLAKLIAAGTGKSLADFARAVLFDPLAIGATAWRLMSNGEPNAASGLRMLPGDVARIGQMLLDRGMAGGRQVVPAAWVDASLRAAVRISDSRSYGYHWYLGQAPIGGAQRQRTEAWVGGIGAGGQRLFIVPAVDLVVVITAGNYNSPDQALPPNRVITEAILPSIQ
jgi:CubicO group peptidase (beta-lactamase class C family)